MNTELLVSKLKEVQSREGWSDREMGRQLKVDHTTWRSIRLGTRGAGMSFVDRALARFPEFTTCLFVPVSVSHTNTARTTPEAA